MARLSYAERQRLPASAFAYPRTRRYPLDTANRARNALTRVAQFGSPGAREHVRAEVHKRYPSIEIDRSNPRVRTYWVTFRRLRDGPYEKSVPIVADGKGVALRIAREQHADLVERAQGGYRITQIQNPERSNPEISFDEMARAYPELRTTDERARAASRRLREASREHLDGRMSNEAYLAIRRQNDDAQRDYDAAERSALTAAKREQRERRRQHREERPHRGGQLAMFERDNPDLVGSLVGTVVPIAALVAGAVWLVNNPGVVGQFFSAVGSAAHGVGGPQGGAAQPPAPVTPGANTGDNQFNFNADPSESYAWQHTTAGNTTGHFGLGHLGPGGTFSATVSARAGGGPFGIGRVDQWHQIWQGTIDVGNDADWTGYSLDFTGTTPPLGMSSEDVQASIDGLSGEHYTNLTLKAHQGT